MPKPAARKASSEAASRPGGDGKALAMLGFRVHVDEVEPAAEEHGLADGCEIFHGERLGQRQLVADALGHRAGVAGEVGLDIREELGRDNGYIVLVHGETAGEDVK